MENARQEYEAARAAMAAKEEELAAEERHVTRMRDELRDIEQEMRAVESNGAVETSNAPEAGSAVVVEDGSAAEVEDAHPAADVQREEGGVEAIGSGEGARRKTRSARPPTAASGRSSLGGYLTPALFIGCWC